MLLECINQWDIVTGESGVEDMSKYTGNMYRQTGLGDSGRRAGAGIIEDDYSEESGFRGYRRDRSYERVRFPSDESKPEELNGPCIIIQEGRKKEERRMMIDANS